MNQYTIQTGEMSRIIGLLLEVLHIQVTFFDLNDQEVPMELPHGMSEYCRNMRRDEEFDRRCRECDQQHLQAAKKLKTVHVYRCHAGLWEGIVPLYNRRQQYLGAIVFGQVSGDGTHPERFPEMRRGSESEMIRIGDLLKYLGEYICENELIKNAAKPWSALLEEYLEDHWMEKITLSDLAAYLHCSESFLSHNIPKEFGRPLKKLIREKRMDQALKLLQQGLQVNECAFKLGYRDEFYFSRDFKRYFGCPPKEMRRRK